MPYAKNALDGRRVYFEDDGGAGSPVVVHGGFLDRVDLVRGSPIARALAEFPEEFRLIYVDHRGHGLSGKPHDGAAYAMPLRVADAVAVLDELDIERAHFIGASWGGRLGFGIGEHAPGRVISLVIIGQQPYAIDPMGPLTRVVSEALEAARTRGIEAWSWRSRRSPGVIRTPSAPRIWRTIPKRCTRRGPPRCPKGRSPRTSPPGVSHA